MRQLFKLVHNENIKLYFKKSIHLMLATLVILTISSAFIMRIYDIAPKTENVWSSIEVQVWLIFIANIFAAVVASGVVSNEFNWGTIKFLLIQPVSRNMILLSKYINIIIFAAILTIIIFLFSFITNTFLYLTNLGDIIVYKSFIKIVSIFFMKYIEIIGYSTIAFMFSVISRNTSFALGFSLVAIFIGPAIEYYLPNKYLLFTNLNLLQHINDNGTINNENLFLSVKVIAFYLFIFNVISWTVFNKRDLGN